MSKIGPWRLGGEGGLVWNIALVSWQPPIPTYQIPQAPKSYFADTFRILDELNLMILIVWATVKNPWPVWITDSSGESLCWGAVSGLPRNFPWTNPWLQDLGACAPLVNSGSKLALSLNNWGEALFQKIIRKRTTLWLTW